MNPDFLQTLGLSEIIELQNDLSRVLHRRFSKNLALVFTDVVGSTAYFQRFGDEAGRRLLQQNHDAVRAMVDDHGGHIVDTAGDGVFSWFPDAESAARALISFQSSLAAERLAFPEEQQLHVRAGLHVGAVLSDGVVVTGDAVNVAARVAGLATGDAIRVSGPAYLTLPGELRLRCRPCPPAKLKGVTKPMSSYDLVWYEQQVFPERVRVEETGVEIVLPDLETIRFGRLKETKTGEVANDVVLALADPDDTKRISRWHFELRRTPFGFRLRQASGQPTEVDGVAVAAGEEAAVLPGTVVRLSRVATLTFLAPYASDDDQMTIGG